MVDCWSLQTAGGWLVHRALPCIQSQLSWLRVSYPESCDHVRSRFITWKHVLFAFFFSCFPIPTDFEPSSKHLINKQAHYFMNARPRMKHFIPFILFAAQSPGPPKAWHLRLGGDDRLSLPSFPLSVVEFWIVNCDLAQSNSWWHLWRLDGVLNTPYMHSGVWRDGWVMIVDEDGMDWGWLTLDGWVRNSVAWLADTLTSFFFFSS